MPLEAEIEEQFVTYAAMRGCTARKLIEKDKRGWPDRTIFCGGNRVLLIEFKRPGGELRADQIATIDALHKVGQKVHVIDSVKMAKEILEDFLVWGRE